MGFMQSCLDVDKFADLGRVEDAAERLKRSLAGRVGVR